MPRARSLTLSRWRGISLKGNRLKDVAPGDGFIVGMGDDLPFDGKLERVARIVELIDKHGRVPNQV